MSKKKITCKQGSVVTYAGGPWDGQRGKLRGTSTLHFSVGGGESGRYEACGPVFRWFPSS